MTAVKKYCKPDTIAEAIALAEKNKNNFRFLAGGTDLMVNKFQGNMVENCLIDITGIKELKNVYIENDFLFIGSLVQLSNLKNYPVIVDEFPVLIEAANSVGSPLIRKTATLGGNILCENRCVFYNQSEWWRESVGYCLKCELPIGKEGGEICIATGGKKACFSKLVSDMAPALISLDARVEIISKKGNKKIFLEEIYSGEGIVPLVLKEAEIIKSIILPLKQNYKSYFKKLRQRESLDFSSLSVSVSVNNKGRVKIALGGVDPGPVVLSGFKGGDKNELIKKAVKMARIVDNDVFPRKYRKEMISVFLVKCFEELSI